MSYFTFLAAIAALQVTMSVLNKLDTSYNVVLIVVVMIDIADDLEVVFITIAIVHTKFVNSNIAYESQLS